MSELKLNLIDTQQILCGNIHGSVADAAVAALSAEPEILAELEAALTRFIKPVTSDSPFAALRIRSELDEEPWDAGVIIIDLAARVVAVESTYSRPGPKGEVRYHDGTQSTDVQVPYRLPDDWVFVYSIAEYSGLSERRRKERAANPPLDARAVLYGRPLIKWIVEIMNSSEGAAIWSALARQRIRVDNSDQSTDTAALATDNSLEQETDTNPISTIHARWLMTPREDLRGQSPRDVLFEKRDFIDFDLNSRELQWTFLDEGPPCLSLDSFAYRFAGFGIHEWVLYYDLVRHLIWSALLCQRLSPGDIQKLKRGGSTESLASPEPVAPDGDTRGHEPMYKTDVPRDIESAIIELDEIKIAWLERPNSDYERIPAVLIENERKRLPIAMSPHEMIVDENCPTCQMMANDPSFGVGFWHLDGSNMDDDFVFSHHCTRDEWEAERAEWRAFSEKFNLEWEEKQKIVRGESVEPEPDLLLDVFDSGVTDSDSSEVEESIPRKSWGPRGWGAS